MRRLGFGVLVDLPSGTRPRVDPRSLTTGIVHLGLGAFHRAHQAVHTEAAMAAAGEPGWGVCGVSPRGRAVADRLVPQDGLYAVLERAAGGVSANVVGTVREVLPAADDPAAVVARIADPAVHVVTTTVTEKAYRVRPSTGRLDPDDPDVAADLAGDSTRTVPGLLLRGLEARMRADAGPLTVACCDNFPGNGALLGGVVADACARLPDGDRLAAWVAASVTFPATMVDRIVPATTDADRGAAADLLGVRDEATVVAEPFSQWVIEDRFAGPRPRWEAAGATLTTDVGPYETAKLRLLNGAHSALAYLGSLAGYEYLADAVAAPELRAYAEALMRREALPTLTAPDGLDLDAYVRALLDRFANPGLRHRTAQIAADGSQKLPQRLLPVARETLSAGGSPSLVAVAVAGWMRYVSAREDETGRPLPVDDPLADALGAATAGADGPAAVAAALLAFGEIFGDLGEDGRWQDLVTDALERLTRLGVRRALTSE